MPGPRPRRRGCRWTCRCIRSAATSSTRTARSRPRTTPVPDRPPVRGGGRLRRGRRRHHPGQHPGAQPARRQLQHRLGLRPGPVRRRLGAGAGAGADHDHDHLRPPHQRAGDLADLQPVPGGRRLRDPVRPAVAEVLHLQGRHRARPDDRRGAGDGPGAQPEVLPRRGRPGQGPGARARPPALRLLPGQLRLGQPHRAPRPHRRRYLPPSPSTTSSTCTTRCCPASCWRATSA